MPFSTKSTDLRPNESPAFMFYNWPMKNTASFQVGRNQTMSGANPPPSAGRGSEHALDLNTQQPLTDCATQACHYKVRQMITARCCQHRQAYTFDQSADEVWLFWPWITKEFPIDLELTCGDIGPICWRIMGRIHGVITIGTEFIGGCEALSLVMFICIKVYI